MPFARAAVTSVFFLLSIYKALVDRANQGVNKERERANEGYAESSTINHVKDCYFSFRSSKMT
jgi:hypothetical protein